jgi:hypothetical protein
MGKTRLMALTRIYTTPKDPQADPNMAAAPVAGHLDPVSRGPDEADCLLRILFFWLVGTTAPPRGESNVTATVLLLRGNVAVFGGDIRGWNRRDSDLQDRPDGCWLEKPYAKLVHNAMNRRDKDGRMVIPRECIEVSFQTSSDSPQ